MKDSISLHSLPHIPGLIQPSPNVLKIRPEHIKIIKEAFKKRLGAKMEFPSLGNLMYTIGGQK